MASPKALSRYSDEYPLLFQAAHEEGVRMHCDTPHAARLLRNELYAYRQALARAVAEPDCPAAILAQALLAYSVTIRVAGSTVGVERHIWLQWSPLEKVL